jgi:hypothetical protein
MNAFYKTARESGATDNGNKWLSRHRDEYNTASVVDEEMHRLELVFHRTDERSGIIFANYCAHIRYFDI